MAHCLPLVKLSESYPWNIVRWLNKYGRPPNEGNDMGAQQASEPDCLHIGPGSSSGGKEKPTTQSNNTETQPGGAKCLMKGCNKVHKSPRSKKPTQSLAFCDQFKKMSIKQRKAVQKELSACTRCLQPGHDLKSCKLDSLKCRVCDGTNHSTLLC